MKTYKEKTPQSIAKQIKAHEKMEDEEWESTQRAWLNEGRSHVISEHNSRHMGYKLLDGPINKPSD